MVFLLDVVLSGLRWQDLIPPHPRHSTGPFVVVLCNQLIDTQAGSTESQCVC